MNKNYKMPHKKELTYNQSIMMFLDRPILFKEKQICQLSMQEETKQILKKLIFHKEKLKQSKTSMFLMELKQDFKVLMMPVKLIRWVT